ncbi:type-2 ice-structuring protein [Lates calcarifer]|uniref:Type-2 ice-structuring protein n=1 Tax=Lates calcarifer TaxID=8187 RepID=A0AAJ7VKV4_LATCA|nr:type-2 ice-structuring protein [Lates calcarifer]XP_018559794.1 type-2 ice-structuring protein [Lates calcarifer]XP_050924521.1 type-2 ice-structuring protein [Lates calcarifer]
MKTLTVSLIVCTLIALTRAAALPPGENEFWPSEHIIVDPVHGGEDYMTPPPNPENYFPHFSCPDGWTNYDTHCLLYVPTKMTWDQAESNCRSKSGIWPATLASVSDAQHADQIHEVMQRAGHEHGQVWVGGHKTTANPSWSWTDPMGFGRFYSFCPKEPAKQEHNCLQINFGENMGGCLEGQQCDTELPSVCSIVLM